MGIPIDSVVKPTRTSVLPEGNSTTSADAPSQTSGPSYNSPGKELAAMRKPGDASRDLGQIEGKQPSAPPAPSQQEKWLDMPVIGKIYGAGQLAHLSLFSGAFEEFSGKATEATKKPDGLLKKTFKWVIGMPIMTVGFLVAALLARSGNEQ